MTSLQSFFPVSMRLPLLAAAFLTAACGAGSDGDRTDGAAGHDTQAASAGEGAGALAEMIQGDPQASVTVIEYASVTCPHCAGVHETIYPEIREKYIDTGKIRYIFRDFPTPPVEIAVAGSMIARCAADSGGPDAYFMVVDALFRTQDVWLFGDTPPRDGLLKIAAQANMDEEDFDTCIRRGDLLDYINAGIGQGREQYGIRSTPSFVVNGTVHNFATAAEFSDILDAALGDSPDHGHTDG